MRCRGFLTSVSASATVGAIGFSSSIGTPAAMHCNACSTCKLIGRREHDAVGAVFLEQFASDL